MFTVLDEKKQLLDSKRPLSREVLTNLKKYFDVEFTYNSNAIEGNQFPRFLYYINKFAL